jgi:hypothetical protein
MAFVDEVQKRTGAPKVFVEITAGGSTYKYCSGRGDATWTAWPLKVQNLSVGVSQLSTVDLSVGDKDFAWSDIVQSSATIDFPVTITLDYDGNQREVFDGQAVSAVRNAGFIDFRCAGAGMSLRQSPRLIFRSEFANVIRGQTVTVGSEIFTFE